MLVRKLDIQTGRTSYDVTFDVDKIEKFTEQRLNGTYKNGCFADEVAKELKANKPNAQEILITEVA
jgi:hypothetical protein